MVENAATEPIECQLSVVIPFLNEQESLPELLSQLGRLAGLPSTHEIIFVSDGSTDRSVEIIQAAAANDDRIKLVCLSRNFGHQPAVSAGLDRTSGDFVGVMDADLQDEPHILVEMLLKAKQESWDVVYAVRAKRAGSLLKRIAYRVFYRLYGFLSETPVGMDSGDFCIMSRRCLSLMRQLPEHSRFHRGLRSWVGLRQIGYPVERPERFAGEPQYSWKGLVRLAVQGLTSFSVRPLRLASLLGLGLCLLSALAAVVYVVTAFMFDLHALAPGFTTIVCLLLFLNGVLLVQLGIIGEYLGNMFLEVKGRPAYLVESVTNLPPST